MRVFEYGDHVVSASRVQERIVAFLDAKSEPPFLVWEKEKYKELVKSNLGKKREGGQITTVMIGLPVVFIFAFVVLAVAAVLLAFGRFSACR